MDKVIEALRHRAEELQPELQERPYWIKDGNFEIALLQTALRTALGSEAEAVLGEVWTLIHEAWSEAGL